MQTGIGNRSSIAQLDIRVNKRTGSPTALCRAAPFASLAHTPLPVLEQLSRTIDALCRSESGQVLAMLVRLLGDLDLAEEAMHDKAFDLNEVAHFCFKEDCRKRDRERRCDRSGRR